MDFAPWGTVYIVRGGKLHKIGCTNGPIEDRLRTLQIGSPLKIELICAFPASEPLHMERELHKIYQGRHVRGEWYRLSEKDVSQLRIDAQNAQREFVKWKAYVNYTDL